MTTAHDKEGYCPLKASDLPILASCENHYTLVFTKVLNLAFLAFYIARASTGEESTQQHMPRTSITDVYAQLKLFSEIICEASNPN